MKLVLVRCSDVSVSRETNVTGLYPPLGLAYLAGSVRARGHEVVILDGDAPRRPAATLAGEVPGDVDLIGFTSTTLGWPAVRSAAPLFRQRFPGVPLIVGGPQVTAFPEETLRHSVFDLGVIGDGERTLDGILGRLAGDEPLAGLPGTAWREAGDIRVDHEVPWCRDIDALPMPALDLLPLDRYTSVVMRRPYTAILASRGCPYRCGFCSQIYTGDTFRTHSPERVLAEMVRAEEVFGAREVVLFDETFGARRREALEICERLARRGLSLRWNARTRIDLLDGELLRAMRDAGCYFLHLGIESGTQRILDSMRKKTNLEQIERVVHEARSMGYQLHGYFMLGYPGETEEEMRRTMAFSRKLPLDWASFTITIPNPRTPLQELAEQKGLIDPDFWQRYVAGETDGVIPYVAARDIGAATLEALKREAYLRFYLRPGSLWRQTGHLRRTGGWGRLVDAGKLWLRELA
ncbi:MAG: radical SAM protein [Pseudomonadota bacterium]